MQLHHVSTHIKDYCIPIVCTVWDTPTQQGKVNRDIKLSNILLSIVEGQLPLVKLADFGFSKDTYRHSEPHSQVHGLPGLLCWAELFLHVCSCARVQAVELSHI